MEDTDGTRMRWGGRSAARDGIDLRASWREASYCAIDVETTGLDLRRDSVVSIGSIGINAGRIVCGDSYYSLIRPACQVSVASMRVHCLRPADLENAPAARDVGQEVARKLAGRIVIAHAAWIERAFLSRLLRQAGLRFAAPVIDTAALARALGYAQGGPHGREPSLELLARQLALPVYAPHHALGDAITTAAVFLALATKAGTGTTKPASARSLVKRSADYSY
jgi:DNA polymerase-3 subunit epsilon